MRGAILTTFASALMGSAVADGLHGRGGHDSFHKRRAAQPDSDNQMCGLTTTVTVYGPPVVITPSPPAPESTTTSSSILTTSSSSSTSRRTSTSTVHSLSYTTVTVSVTERPAPTSTPVNPEQPTTIPESSSSPAPSPPAPQPSTTTPAPAPSQPASSAETPTSVSSSSGSAGASSPAPAPSQPASSAETPTSVNSSSNSPSTSSPAPVTTPVSSAPVTTPVPETTTSASPSSSSSSAAAPSSTGQIGGKRFGVTYSPYTNDSQCKDDKSVASDIAVAKEKGFSAVRIYSTDCNGLKNVGAAARQHGLKVIVGVDISQDGVSKAQEQVEAINKWAQWDLVNLIVVGNEAVQNGYIDASTLASFIQSSKSSFKNAGYTGEVTTTEPLDIWQQSGNILCGAVDAVGANLHPFYNAQVSAAKAGKFVLDELKILGGICPNKQTYNLETGWPNAGNANGEAVPGVSEQLIAIKAIDLAAGDKSVFFSYSDDMWKPAGQFDVEQHWGCIKAFS